MRSETLQIKKTDLTFTFLLKVTKVLQCEPTSLTQSHNFKTIESTEILTSSTLGVAQHACGHVVQLH